MIILKKYFINAGLFAVLLAFSNCTHKEEVNKPEENLPKGEVRLTTEQTQILGIDTAKLVNDESELALTGKVGFDEDKVTKVYPLASGSVTKVNVSLGDHVERGKELAILRSSEINDMQSQHDVAVSALNVAKKNLDIAKELYKTNVYSEKDLLNAENDYKKASSDVNKVKQQLDIYRANPNKNDAEYRILAPIDGYIVEKNISEGMQVRSDAGSNVFTVSYINTVWVIADVYENDLAKVKEGDEVEVTTVAYPDKIFKGTVKLISSLLDPTTKTAKIRVVLDNKDGMLKPEMFAIVKVHNKTPDKVISIPSKALVFDNSQFYVMVVKGNNTFERRPVELLRNTGEQAFIKKGLQKGERIVTDGSLLVSYSGK
jgi:cobalt-zinc-cadmium efflux system membrane fusion protein